MFEKRKLKKEIDKCKKNIDDLEQKRSRSQAALVEAILTQAEPDDRDVDFFNLFTGKITEERNKMHELMQKLEELELKK